MSAKTFRVELRLPLATPGLVPDDRYGGKKETLSSHFPELCLPGEVEEKEIEAQAELDEERFKIKTPRP